ncbi:alpha-D-ribose 1-methylphosphonate 5-triphosphate diphosphatase PhnM [Sinorhizobium fredii]
MSALIHLLPENECEAAVLGITALIDGLWLRLGLQSEGLTREDALRQMRDYLTSSAARRRRTSISRRPLSLHVKVE